MGPEPLRPGVARGDTGGSVSRYFPVALDLVDRRCLVVGGGAVAARKIRALLEAGAQVVVVAPDISPGIQHLVGDAGAQIELRRRRFEPPDLEDAFVVVTATNDPSVNALVAEQARARRVLVNAADDPANCDFILPAVVHRGDIQIAITTGGQSPALARHLRERLDRDVPREYAQLADVLGALREELRETGTRVSATAWQDAISDDALGALREGDVARVTEFIRSRLLHFGSDSMGDLPTTSSSPGKREVSSDPSPTIAEPRRDVRGGRGRIVLVGAGPGDPGLLTVAGQRAISEADVVVYDRLVNAVLLDSARADARTVYAGKSRGGAPMSQEEINQLICDEASMGNVVVRLKGGDPFVFGRGGEEALAAVQAGIPFTVIPGISAATAAPAYAGIPVTHRGLSSSFTVLTGHEDPTKPNTAVDWDVLARAGGTIVLLMGVDTLPGICQRLIAAGLAPETPAAVIQDATRESQRTVTGTVGDIAERASAARIRAPATTVIGNVVELAPILSWWGSCAEAAHETDR